MTKVSAKDAHNRAAAPFGRRVTELDAEMGERLRLARRMLKMSQTELGERAGVTFQQIQKYERGVNRISAARLYQFSQILGKPIAYFYPDEHELGANEEALLKPLKSLSPHDAAQILRVLDKSSAKARENILGVIRMLDSNSDA